jgi:hypothetical protein
MDLQNNVGVERKESYEPGWGNHKHTAAQQLNTFAEFYGSQQFITVFTTARHWSVS